MNQKHTTAIIIGAGAAGLSAAVCLKRLAVPFIILEEREKPGGKWVDRYDRLHLHTPAKYSALPYFKIPAHYPKYLSRDDYAAYLSAYAAAFNIEPLLNHKVTSAAREGNEWKVQAGDATFHAPYLVIATGLAQQPVMPSYSGMQQFHGQMLHSVDYKNGAAFENKRVLVVGFGNSAGEIAICLHEHGALPCLSVRNPVNIVPREIGGISIISIAIAERWISRLSPAVTDAINQPLLRFINGNLKRLGLQPLPYGAISQIMKHRSVPLLDIGTLDLIRNGRIKVYPGIDALTPQGVRFVNGSQESFDAIIFATGYQPGYNSFLNINSESAIHSRENSSNWSLYFCGFEVTPTGMLREIAMEARKIAKAIASGLPIA